MPVQDKALKMYVSWYQQVLGFSADELLPSAHRRPSPLVPSRSLYSSLAIGSPLSALQQTAQKISAINAKHGPFDAVFLVGDAFKEGSSGEELEGLSCAFDTMSRRTVMLTLFSPCSYVLHHRSDRSA